MHINKKTQFKKTSKVKNKTKKIYTSYKANETKKIYLFYKANEILSALSTYPYDIFTYKSINDGQREERIKKLNQEELLEKELTKIVEEINKLETTDKIKRYLNFYRLNISIEKPNMSFERYKRDPSKIRTKKVKSIKIPLSLAYKLKNLTISLAIISSVLFTVSKLENEKVAVEKTLNEIVKLKKSITDEIKNSEEEIAFQTAINILNLIEKPSIKEVNSVDELIDAYFPQGVEKLLRESGWKKVLNIVFLSSNNEIIQNSLFAGYYLTDVDPYIVLSILLSENAGEIKSVYEAKNVIKNMPKYIPTSHANAIGVAQITKSGWNYAISNMPDEIKKLFTNYHSSVTDLESSIIASFYYIKGTIENIKHPTLDDIAIAYNCGGKCLSYKKLPDETELYIKKVRNNYQIIKNNETNMETIMKTGKPPIIIKYIKSP